MLRYIPGVIASAALLTLVYLVFLIFKPFAVSLVFAAVMAILFDPIYVRLNRRISKFWASLLCTVIVFVVIIIPALAIVTGIVHEALNLSQTVGSVDKLMTQAHTQATRLGIDLQALIKDAANSLVNQAGKLASQIIGNAFSVFLGIVVALLATFFFFRDGKKALSIIQRLPLNNKWGMDLVIEIGSMIKANITASFVAAFLQGTIGGLAFAWLDLPAPILWGTVMGFFSVFPFVGSWLVWLPTVAGLVMAGRGWDAIILAVIGLAVVNPIDNILRPAIVASATHLNGLLIFVGLLGGVQAFGVSGLLFGPVLMIIGASLLKSLPPVKTGKIAG